MDRYKSHIVGKAVIHSRSANLAETKWNSLMRKAKELGIELTLLVETEWLYDEETDSELSK